MTLQPQECEQIVAVAELDAFVEMEGLGGRCVPGRGAT